MDFLSDDERAIPKMPSVHANTHSNSVLQSIQFIDNTQCQGWLAASWDAANPDEQPTLRR